MMCSNEKNRNLSNIMSLLGMRPKMFKKHTDQLIFKACRNGNSFELESILSDGADPNCEGYHYPPLHIACKYHPKLIKVLLNYGADINVKNSSYKTPLHMACEYKLSSVKILLDCGADLNVIDHEGNTPLHVACQHNRKIAKYLLSKKVKLNIKNYRDNTPLHIACVYKPSLVKYFLKAGSNPNIKNINGYTPLHVACRYNKNVVKHFINTNANPNIKNKYSGYPIHTISDPKTMSIILKLGANPDQECKDETPLCRACYKQKSEMVKVLLDGGANPNLPGSVHIDRRKKTPLYYACTSDDAISVKYLLEAGANIDLSDDNFKVSDIGYELKIDEEKIKFSKKGILYKYLKKIYKEISKVTHFGPDRIIMKFLFGLQTNHQIYNLLDKKIYKKKA